MANRTKKISDKTATRIKQLRIARELTQVELAKKLFKSESAVRMWELGKSEPDIETLGKLSEIFGVNIDYLLGNDKDFEEDVIVWHRNGEVGRAKLSKENYDAIVQMIKATSEKPKDEDI